VLAFDQWRRGVIPMDAATEFAAEFWWAITHR